MRIIYRKTTLMTVCEVTLNRMYITEPENFERVLLENEEYVMTSTGTYNKNELEEKK